MFIQLQVPSPQLQIDPLLLVEANEIATILRDSRNPVWPGWNIRKTPILVYLPGRQDVLINHPHPPAGFRPYQGGFQSPLGKLWLKDGPTIVEFDGQNTSIDVNGTQTLVVADTLSVRKQWIESLGDSTDDLMNRGLYPNPYSNITLFAHEAFHVFQHHRAPQKAGNELTLTGYPSLSVENNVGFALEAQALADATRAESVAEARRAGIRWLAIRKDRRKHLRAEDAAYEDGTEFNEGLAKYVEYRLLEALEGKKPAAPMWLAQGFRGYDNLRKPRESMVQSMIGFMSGKSVVNGDLYGASPVRFRLYFSGMAIGTLLDKLGGEWKSKAFQPGTTLTQLAEEHLRASPAELSEALSQARTRPDYLALVAQKTELAQKGAVYTAELLAKLDQAPGELVIDYSALDDKKVAFGYTPFGILRVDDDRSFFRLVPLRGSAGKASIAQTDAKPVLQDRKQKQLRFELTSAPDGSRTLKNEDLTLPGVSLKNVTGELKVEGRRAVLKLRQD